MPNVTHNKCQKRSFLVCSRSIEAIMLRYKKDWEKTEAQSGDYSVLDDLQDANGNQTIRDDCRFGKPERSIAVIKRIVRVTQNNKSLNNCLI